MADTQSKPSNSTNQSIADFIEINSLSQEGLLQSIALDLKAIARKDGIVISQSSLKDLMIAEQRNDRVIERQRKARNPYDSRTRSQGERSTTSQKSSQQTGYRRNRSKDNDYFDFDKRSVRGRAGKLWEDVIDSFEETLIEGLTGSKNPFDTVFKNLVDNFQNSLGIDKVENIGPEIAKRVLKNLDKVQYRQASGTMTTVGKQLREELNWFKNGINNVLNSSMRTITSSLGAEWQDMDLFKEFSDLKRSNEDPKVRDITEVRNAVDQGLENISQGQDDIWQVTSEAARDISSTLQSSTQEIINAIQQSNGSQGAPELRNELDDIDNGKVVPEEVVDGNWREVGEQRSVEVSADDAVGEVVDEAGNLLSMLDKGKAGLSVVRNAVSSLTQGTIEAGAAETGLATVASGASTSLTTLAGGVAELGATVPTLIPAILAMSLAVEAISAVVEKIMGPAMEGIDSFVKALQKAGNRELTLRQKYNELAQKRLEDDLRSIREAAYSIIQDAAKRVEQVWDSVESTVAATQGKTKAKVQDLWQKFATDLQKEGLDRYVSSADIMEKLESVLKQGLSGEAAEEFAYQATLLNQMIPTEDFFQYASSYASIIGQTINSGGDLATGIENANAALRDFANSLLYSKKQNDGLTTTLSSASDLFTKAAEIAVASQNTNRSTLANLSTTFTMLSGAVGSIAPDLANGLVDAIYRAAVGGNSSEITALRSLAGTGASNTAFLKALVQAPQKVISTMFNNLSILQARSSANYMEVAEGLSSIFGISMEAFSRIDFAKLSSKLESASAGDETYLELAEKALKSGETTSTDSQNRIAKINEYMMKEGLAYVLDNEVARSIQEHMWQEQLAREIESANYSVDLIGGARSALLGIEKTLQRYVAYSVGLGWVEELKNVALTASEAAVATADTAKILKAGKVGKGNDDAYKALTTSNQDLGVATPIVTLLTGDAPTTLGSSVVDGVKSLFDKVKSVVSALKRPATSTGTSTSSTSGTTSQSKTVGGNSIPRRTAKRIAEDVADGMTDAIYETVHQSMVQAVDVVGSEDIGPGEEDVWDPDNPYYNTPAIVDNNEPSEPATVPSTSVNPTEVPILPQTGSELFEELGPLLPPGTGTEYIAGKVDKVTKAATNTYAKLMDQSKSAISKAADRLTTAISSGFSQMYTISKDDSEQLLKAYRAQGSQLVNKGYNALYGNEIESGTALYKEATQKSAKELSELINASLEDYILKGREAALSLENFRYEITEDKENMLTENMAANLKALEDEGQGRGLQHRGFYDQSQLIEEVFNKSAELTEANQTISFEDWLATFEESTGILNLTALLSEYGTTIDTIRDAYESQAAARQSAATKARDLHEVQFWEDMQNFATVDFPWYLREWERYFIQHEAYTEATAEAYNEAVALAVEEKGEMGDSVLALAEALTENTIWQQELGNAIKDPQVQTNAILSKILLCVEAIMQQNNETSIVSVPTALSSLGLGISNV